MSKDNKNPYLSGEQPKNTVDYRMILEEQRARREREQLKPGKQSMVINREALGLPPLTAPEKAEIPDRFKFDIEKDVKQNVDLTNLGTGEDKYGSNYRPQAENPGSRSMYDVLAQTGNATQEEVSSLFGVDAARRSPERKAPVSAPKRSIEERRAELDSMLPDQGQITLESIMKERQKTLPMPSLIVPEQPETAEPAPIPDIEAIDVVTPLKENINLPGFEFRQRYLRNGLDPQQNEELPQRVGFGGKGGRMPEFESETKNWSDRAADELFAPIERKKTVVYPMRDPENEVERAPKRVGAQRRTVAEVRAEQPRELTRQEIIAQSHAVRRKNREKRRTAIGGYIQNPVPDEMDAGRAYAAGRENAAFLAQQEAELARKHAEIARAMDMMDEINSGAPSAEQEQEQPIMSAPPQIEEPMFTDGFGGLDEMTYQNQTFAPPPAQPESEPEPPQNSRRIAPGKKSMFSYLFNDDEPVPDTFSDYTKYAQPHEDNAPPSYGYLYVNDDDIRRHAVTAEESITAEDEPHGGFMPLEGFEYTQSGEHQQGFMPLEGFENTQPDELHQDFMPIEGFEYTVPNESETGFMAPPGFGNEKPAQKREKKPRLNGGRKSDKRLEFEIPLEKQVRSAPNMKPKDFSEVIDGQDDEDPFDDGGGFFGNINEEPPVETASEEKAEKSAPVDSDLPSDNLWDEIAKERKSGSVEMKKKIIEFTGEMIGRGNEAAAKLKEQLEEKRAVRKRTSDEKPAGEESETDYSEYTSEAQADEIKNEMLEKLSELIFRGIANCAFFLILLLLEVLPALGVNLPYISQSVSPVNYYIINTVFTLFIIGTNYIVPYHSVKNLLEKRIDGSFGLVAASAAALVQNVSMIFGGSLRSYTVMLAFAFLVNTIGEFINITRVGKNFAFISADFRKGAVMLADDNVVLDSENADGAEPVAAYSIKTKFLSDYLSFAYEEDPGEISGARTAPVFAAASLAVGILAGCISRSFFTGISAMTAACIISVPVTRLFCANLPLLMKVKELKQSGAMLSGWAAVDEFGDVNVLSVDDKLLFPSSCLKIDSIRVFDQSKKSLAAKTAAAVLSTFGGALARTFMKVIGSEAEELPLVTDLEYLEGEGFSGKLDGDAIVFGTLAILKRFDIEMPEVDYEALFKKTNFEIFYLAIGNKLSAMFIVAYKTDKKTASALRELEETGVKLNIRTFDPVINSRSIAKKFGVSESFTAIINNYFDDSSSVYNVTCETAPAVIGTNRTLAGAAKGISAAVTIRSSIAVGVILQTIGCFLGFILVAVFACSGVSTMISPLKLTAYIAFWIAAVIIAPIIDMCSPKRREKKTKKAKKNRR